MQLLTKRGKTVCYDVAMERAVQSVCPLVSELGDTIHSNEVSGTVDHENRRKMARLFEASSDCDACKAGKGRADRDDCRFLKILNIEVGDSSL